MFTYVSHEVHHSGQRHRRCTDENPDARQSSDSRHSRHITVAFQAYTVHVSTALFAVMLVCPSPPPPTVQGYTKLRKINRITRTYDCRSRVE